MADPAAVARTLIVNADDFGRSPGINAGVVRAHKHGIVTSASLMVRWPSARPAAESARVLPRLGVGLHLDLGEWAFVDGAWRESYHVVDTDDAGAVDREVRSQLARFRELMGADPTHLDSHQHVHREGLVADIADTLGRELGVPVRRRTSGISYCGEFYGQARDGSPQHDAITWESLVAILRRLPEGVTELACHPGERDVGDRLYGIERTLELAQLCDPRTRAVIDAEVISLTSFRARRLHP
ncbi:MAG TPA: ChbG/HpnK family deacetylase [Solirubrobacteraceae bacterium]|nr:ChbG/HpnK family deacetylase [Solirubrobacteraceae bacterium]